MRRRYFLRRAVLHLAGGWGLGRIWPMTASYLMHLIPQHLLQASFQYCEQYPGGGSEVRGHFKPWSISDSVRFKRA